MMELFGAFLIPVSICLIIAFGLLRGVPVFDTFLTGAREGLSATISVLPSLIALIMAVTMLSASGALDIFCSFLRPAVQRMGFPEEVIPLALLRPISGSGSIAILTHILDKAGADSFAGRVASVMMGSTETTFYAIAVYFGSVGIKKTRHAIPAALAADVTGYFMSVLFVRLFF